MRRKRHVAIGLGLLVVLAVGVNLLFHEETPNPENPYRDQLIAIARAVRSASGGKCRVLFRQGAGANPRTGQWPMPLPRFSTRYLFKWRGKGYIRLRQDTGTYIIVYPVSGSSRVSLEGFGNCRVLGVLETRTAFRLSELTEDGGSGERGAYLLVLPEGTGSEKRFVVLGVEPDEKGRYRFEEVAHGPLEEVAPDRKTKARVVAEFPDGATASIQNPAGRATIKFVFRKREYRIWIDFNIRFI